MLLVRAKYQPVSLNPRPYKMTETTRTVVMKLIGHILSALVHLGIGIYSAVILANNSKDIVPIYVYGFTMTICILHFLLSVNSLYLVFIPNKKSVSVVDFAILGLFIWSAIILFVQDGNLLKDYNPYYMVVFVYFVLNAIILGLAIIILPCMCCFACYKLSKIDTKKLEATQKKLDIAIKQLELTLSKNIPPSPICTNV
jgi:hypothetical protein